MPDIIYRSSMGDRLCKLLVGAGIVCGAFYAGGRLADFRHDEMPYSVMKGKDAYYLVEKKTDGFRRIDENLFEKIVDEKKNGGNAVGYEPFLPKK